MTRTSQRIPRSISSFSAASIARQVALGAHHDPHPRRVDLELLELGHGLGERLGARGGLSLGIGAQLHDLARAMSRRICLPSNSIMSAAAYAASRAAAASAPSAVTFSTRPPAVTTAPSAPARCPRG